MLYIKDNIIKDSSLITLTINDKIVYNPSQELLEENGWSVYNESNLNQFINKRYIETTSSVFNNVDKSDLKDTIVFIKDVSKIYLNGNEYYCGSSELSNYEDDYGFGITYISEICLNNNWYELSIPCAGYNDYSEKGWGTTNIGQFVSNDGEGYNVNIPNSTYEDFIGEEKSTHIGDFQFAGNTYPVYIPEIKEPEFIKNVTIEELNNLKKEGKLIPGQKYNITNFKTTIDESIGNVIYKDNEKHELIFTALGKSELDNDATSIQTFKSSYNIVGELEPTGDFELIAYKCDWDPDNSRYTEDDEYYKYKGDTVEIDGVTHYIWTKYEGGVPLLDGEGYAMGKSRVVTSSLDFECSLNNPYHPDYVIYEDDSINDQYQFEEPSEDNENEGEFTDSFCRVERIDHPVYNYKVIANVCDWDNDNEEYGYDDISWYVYYGDTIDLDGVTYFVWYKPGVDPNYCCPLTDTLYLDCSIENPYTPELWVTVDGELNNDYFDPTKTDIFCGIKESNLPNLVQEIEVIDREPVTTKVQADLDTKKILDESQIVSAVAFKTKFNPDHPELKNYVDYEGLYYYHGDQINVDRQDYYVWDKYSNDTGEGFISIDYRKDNGYYWAQILTEKLYINCSLKNPYIQDYVIQEGDTINGYDIGSDKIVDIHYFNNVTNYIRFENNGWYVRCPELDRDGKFGWAYITNEINSQDGNSYVWFSGDGDGNSLGPIPCFLNNPDLGDNDYFLTDTLDPQVGDSFCRNDGDELDTIDKVWGTIIEPEISCRGIYHMKDEFGNEAPYDFKHIQFEGLYTFGNETEDFSLNGFENKVYNNKIMKPIDSQYNRINLSEKNVYGNTIYPSVTDCVIDFSVKESLITKSELGLHIFNPKDFITPIRVDPLVVSENQIINYTTSNEQIVDPKQDAFGDANIISNKYK